MGKTRLRIEVKRFLLRQFHPIVAICAVVLVGAILFTLCYIVRHEEHILLKIGLSGRNPLTLGIVAGLIVTVSVGLVKRFVFLKSCLLNRLRSYLFRKLLPVNNAICDKHTKQFETYFKALRERIKKLIPEELADAWDGNGEGVPPTLIRARGKEILTIRSKSDYYGNIKDVFDFIERELIFNVNIGVHPLTIQGEPGSGKSSFVFELFRQLSNQLCTYKQGWIPILLFAHELSCEQVNNSKTLKDLLVEYFRQSQERHTNKQGFIEIVELLSQHYEDYQFFIIVDGLDEITDRPMYEHMTRRLNELVTLDMKAHNYSQEHGIPVNRYMITCRTDDNQRLIDGRLVTLAPIDFADVLAHMKQLRRHYKRAGDIGKFNQQRKMIKALKQGKATKLLQNYVQNPYLLSLIVEYYRYIEEPPAKRLNEVFEHVLERELGKPAHHKESEEKRVERMHLRCYLSSLLAPYCFFRTVESLNGRTIDTKQEEFGMYIKKNPILGRLLFGNESYLYGIYKGDIKIRETLYHEIAKWWGENKTKAFSAHLSGLLTKGEISLEEFEYGAIEYLRQDVMTALENSNLAEIDYKNRVVKRFRHRRMQDYFMALYVDTVGAGSEDWERFDIQNAWMREPLRITGAITAKADELIGTFVKAYDQNAKQKLDDNLANSLANIMVNGSELIAYLPRSQGNPDESTLRAVQEIGKRATDLYKIVSQRATKEGTQADWLGLREKCLYVLHNIYASEFLAPLKELDPFYKFQQDFEGIHRRILLEHDSYQHIAYQHLYPIARGHVNFPAQRSSMMLYIIDAAFCFHESYQRLVVETHPRKIDRLLFWLTSLVESVFAVGMCLFLLMMSVDPTNPIIPLSTKALMLLIFLTCYCVFALSAQALGLMGCTEFHHIGMWVGLKVGKRIWIVVLIALKYIIELIDRVVRWAPKGIWCLGKLLLKLAMYSITLIYHGSLLMSKAILLAITSAPAILTYIVKKCAKVLVLIMRLLPIFLKRLLCAILKRHLTEIRAAPNPHTISLPQGPNPGLVPDSRKVSTPPGEPRPIKPRRPKPIHRNWGPVVKILAITVVVIASVILGLFVFHPLREYTSAVHANKLKGDIHAFIRNVKKLEDIIKSIENSEIYKEGQFKEMAVFNSIMTKLDKSKNDLILLIDRSKYVRELRDKYPENQSIKSAYESIDSLADSQEQLKKYEDRLLLQKDRLLFRQKRWRWIADAQTCVGEYTVIDPDTLEKEDAIRNSMGSLENRRQRIKSLLGDYNVLFPTGDSEAEEIVVVNLKNDLEKLQATVQAEIGKLSTMLTVVPPRDHHETSEESRRKALDRIEMLIKGAPIENTQAEVTAQKRYQQRWRERVQKDVPKQWLGKVAIIRLWRLRQLLGEAKQAKDDQMDQDNWRDPVTQFLEGSSLALNELEKDRDSWSSQEEQRFSELKALRDRISSLATELAQLNTEVTRVNIDDYISRLSKQISTAREESYAQSIGIGKVVVILACLVSVWAAIRMFGDKKGLTTLESCRGDLSKILAFLKRNRYSLKVNRRAIAYLEEIAPDKLNTVEASKQISEVATELLGRVGHMREYLGNLLREKAKGIDHILDRCR